MSFIKQSDEVDDTLPTPVQMGAAQSISIQDSKGEHYPLSSILKGRRTLITFVRHHHCGMCFEFVRALSNDSFFSTLGAGSEGDEKPQVIVVGHGPAPGIEMYKERSECKFDMYVDPEHRLYQALGMTRKHLGGLNSKERPSHFQNKSVTGLVLSSIGTMVKDIFAVGMEGGEFSQLGGDFIIDEKGQCVFCHRMQTTMDHVEVSKLASILKGEQNSVELGQTPAVTTTPEQVKSA